MKARMEVKGLEDYAAKLVKAGADIDACANKALAAAAPILYNSILPLIPVDTGNLREHLVVNGPIQKDNAHFVYIEMDMQDREQMLYAVYQEFGTARQPARAYMRTGVSRAKARASQAIKDVFEQYLEAL
jgi:HK97 gp10 family phage protein